MHRNLFIIFLLLSICVSAQIKLPPIEGWRLHASFATNNDLVEVGEYIYVGSVNGMFSYRKSDNEIEVISKINGLSDMTIKKMAYDQPTKTLVIAYDNINIDLVNGTDVTNLSEILSQSIIGTKEVNNISVYNSKAYLSCSFGIAVVDLEKKKITDSYTNLGPGGTNLNIQDVAVYNNNIYFAAPNGIYRASLSSPNLSDYNAWQLIKSSTFTNQMEAFRGKLYATIDSTLYTYDGISWTIYPGSVSQYTTDMRVTNNTLINSYKSEIWFESSDGTLDKESLSGTTASILGNNGFVYLIAPSNYFSRFDRNTKQQDYYAPSGPSGSTATRMAYYDKNLWVAAGQVNGFGTNAGWSNSYGPNKMYRFNNNNWYNYNNNSTVHGTDFIDVTIHPDTKLAYFASFGNGVVVMDENNAVKYYDTSNSTLQAFNSGIPTFKPLFASGVNFDNDKNLWVSNFGAVEPLSVLTKNGQWFSFPFPSSIDNRLGFVTCDDEGSKWIMTTRGLGIVVFNENKTFGYTDDDHIKLLTDQKQNGYLPSNTVFCMTKEEKGEMWVGTAEGLCIFRNPGNVFKSNADFDAEQLVIKTGLVYSNFLGGVPVYSIRIDAANRKWIGTANGVWLTSPDGYTVIKNFTTSNSPLPSNTVYEVGIDNSTGEVFFGTEKGIVSYMGTATDGGDTFGNVVAYPNPVRPDYTGLIAIKGLIDNAYVKITDIAGNLVYETRANGGMATWNGLNFNGKRAATGVYLVFSINEDGTESNVTKILFIN